MTAEAFNLNVKLTGILVLLIFLSEYMCVVDLVFFVDKVAHERFLFVFSLVCLSSYAAHLVKTCFHLTSTLRLFGVRIVFLLDHSLSWILRWPDHFEKAVCVTLTKL